MRHAVLCLCLESLYEGCCFGSFFGVLIRGMLFWIFCWGPYLRDAVLGPTFWSSYIRDAVFVSFLESLYEGCCFGSFFGVLI